MLRALARDTTFAFQPVVDLRTGAAFGFEALLRGHDRLGFATVPALIDHSFERCDPVAVDLLLRERAIERFAGFGLAIGARLFFNIENRTLEHAGWRSEITAALLARHGVPAHLFCSEISEQYPIGDVAAIVARLRPSTGGQGRAGAELIALDDFGTGHACARLLSESRADLIKIDRCFVAGVDRDARRRAILAAMVAVGHASGALVVCEGVETEAELACCRAAGADLVQGYLIARPTTDLASLRAFYPAAVTIAARPHPAAIPALRAGASVADLLASFVAHPRSAALPVLDADGRPLGVITEAALRPVLLAPGFDALAQDSRSLLNACPVIDIADGARNAGVAPGPVIVTENGRYLGMLTPANDVAGSDPEAPG